MNNSKQTVLSIVGIAILVIAVVGVSFAFFTYSRVGTTNNVITTGSISFVYNDSELVDLVVSNQFPRSTSEALADTTNQFDFEVVGTVPSSVKAITYNVYAVPGADTPQGSNRFENEEISLYVNGAGADASYAVGAPLTDAIDGTPGQLIATSTIAADGNEHTNAYAVKIWVNNSVTISDTDRDATYRASSITGENAQYDTGTYNSLSAAQAGDTRKVYNTMFYSIKIKVTADNN